MEQEVKDRLLDLCSSVNDNLYNIFVHWSAGYYNSAFYDYHINILGNGEVVITCDSLNERKAHTWRRNTGNIGVALACAYGAHIYGDKPNNIDFGECPPTQEQLDSLVEVLKLLCEHLDISTEHVMTHAEIAEVDGYGIHDNDPELKWDLLYVPVGDDIVPGGDYIRRRLDEG